MKNKKAFTLVELLVVIAIIGILATLAISNYAMAMRKGRDAKQKSDISNIQQALILYRADNGTYPLGGGDTVADVELVAGGTALEDELVEDYLAQIPSVQRSLDGSQYKYFPECQDGRCTKFTLCTATLEARAGDRSLSGANADADGNIGDPGAGEGNCNSITGNNCTRYCVGNP